MKNPYRENVLDAIRNLYEAEILIYTSLIEVAFTGIYKEINDVIVEGEEIVTDIAWFEDTSDVNVEILLRILKRICTTRLSMVNLNAVKDEEFGS